MIRKISRCIVRIFLVMALAITIALILLNKKDMISPILLVLSTAISIYTAQKIIEKEEDDKFPLVELRLDFSKRYGLVLFELLNRGKTNAYDIEITFVDNPVKKDKSIVRFGREDKPYYIPILMSGESLYFIWDTSHELIELFPQELQGTIVYFDSRKSYRTKLNNEIYISLKSYEHEVYYKDEMQKAYYEIQQIPKKLNEISKLNETLRVKFKKGLTIEELEELEEQEELISFLNKIRDKESS